ncbi:hypothetical protein PIROE2DRAFT_3772 [Piromyces sp. E2]|nr:hypothetical protein PIROE2DRAFT_3772 [Piromyces sp. E2]|eukprot:OUM68484.1 hypothetical protein PIROE2DRAFT_3772 [Piromyces sp. E2]
MNDKDVNYSDGNIVLFKRNDWNNDEWNNDCNENQWNNNYNNNGLQFYSHCKNPMNWTVTLISEMKQLEDIVFQVIDKRSVFMRPPYSFGNGNQNVISSIYWLHRSH